MWPFNRYPTLKLVIVNLKTDTSFRGVFWGRRGQWLILRKAQLIRPKAAPLPIDGEVLIDRANIDWVQVVS